MTDLSSLTLDELLDEFGDSEPASFRSKIRAEIRRRFAMLEREADEATQELAVELADERILHQQTLARIGVLERERVELRTARLARVEALEAALRNADHIASVIHDAIYAEPFRKEVANEAVWRLHNAIRPFIGFPAALAGEPKEDALPPRNVRARLLDVPEVVGRDELSIWYANLDEEA